MAELPQWSAQALRYHGSDGPVKVVYFANRQELATAEQGTSSISVNRGWPKEVELPEKSPPLISPHSGRGDFWSGDLFSTTPVSDAYREFYFDNYYRKIWEIIFENIESAIRDLKSKFKNPKHGPKVVPLNLNNVSTKVQHDLLKANAIHQEDIDAVTAKKAEPKTQQTHGDRRNESVVTDNEILGMGNQGVRACRCALVCGITTEVNPSGIWIIEDFYNDGEEAQY